MDTTPGLVKAGLDGEGHPGQLIQTLKKLPTPVSIRFELQIGKEKLMFHLPRLLLKRSSSHL